MTIIPKKANPYDLTDEEAEFLRSSAQVPGEAKRFLARQHGNIGVKVTSYRKVAAAARAEADMLLAIMDRDEVIGELTDLAEAKQRLATIERRAAALEATVTVRDKEIAALSARPALAVHSGD